MCGGFLYYAYESEDWHVFFVKRGWGRREKTDGWQGHEECAAQTCEDLILDDVVLQILQYVREIISQIAPPAISGDHHRAETHSSPWTQCNRRGNVNRSRRAKMSAGPLLMHAHMHTHRHDPTCAEVEKSDTSDTFSDTS